MKLTPFFGVLTGDDAQGLPWRGCAEAPMAIPTIEPALAQLMYIIDCRVKGGP
jgi:hypothetical protein